MKVLHFDESDLTGIKAEMLVVPVLEGLSARTRSSKFLQQVDDALGTPLAEYLSSYEIEAGNGKDLTVPIVGGDSKAVFAFALQSAEKNFDKIRNIRRAAQSIVSKAKALSVSSVAIYCPQLLANPVFAEAFVEAADCGTYQLKGFKSEQKEHPLQELLLIGGRVTQRSLDIGLAMAGGIQLAREVVLLPPNAKRPVDLAERISSVFGEHAERFKVSTFDRKALKAMGMGGILAVGGAGEPVLMRILYVPEGFPADTTPKIAIIGKGVTMDTGGYALKPGNTQFAMKCDCGGGAAVFGAMFALTGILPTTPVVAYVPLVENLISEKAFLNADVLTMRNGKKVEIHNTDAEGRLILADAIALAVEKECETIIDLATLTGAAVVALGQDYAALYSNNTELRDELREAAHLASERVWQMPLAEEYNEQLKSGIADIKNIGGRYGGSITAALFLQNFIGENTRWAHLDIAGPAGKGLDQGDAPGFAVGTLARYVMALEGK